MGIEKNKNRKKAPKKKPSAVVKMQKAIKHREVSLQKKQNARRKLLEMFDSIEENFGQQLSLIDRLRISIRAMEMSKNPNDKKGLAQARKMLAKALKDLKTKQKINPKLEALRKQMMKFMPPIPLLKGKTLTEDGMKLLKRMEQEKKRKQAEMLRIKKLMEQLKALKKQVKKKRK